MDPPTQPPPLHPLHFKRGSKFLLPHSEGGFRKIKKRGWKHDAGTDIVKREGVGGGVGVGVGEEEGGRTFPPSFFQGLSILIIEITLLFAKLCYVFFSSTITL